MDYYDHIELAISFMEKHLTENIRVEDVSKNAFQSRWHFQRIFRYVTGYSVYTYLKKRRLTEAGNDLILGKEKIIDIALKYHYATPESFLRAFRTEFGINPSDFRKTSEHRNFLKLEIEPLRDKIRIDGSRIKTQIITKNEFVLIGKPRRTTMQKCQNEIDIPKFWGDFFGEGLMNFIPNRIGNSLMGIYTNWDYAENFDVIIGAQVKDDSKVPDGFVIHRMKPTKYMVFTVPGNTNEDILNGWKYIYGTWMPNTGYEREFSDDFDVFDDRFQSETNPESEIYIPIK
ncbi:AraC family transcriptional regulator [Leptospira congkakensis]|uniref:AraC family transcriptional regulator n=1 Tax=Leptospira congkakensis TaxID=2484932 RepID=A0A4Z1AGZ3_9LEPT|nr:AraC family transcriptional regulator [Leptospira congkakensis]TGL90667.1 AraC family transcriptional regulator [Leptospira congkakensis]TGL91674.1 AraC family transcriptional regulator [Leptospira congkakensis]TGL98726.1 AraC family transcriptional regulator [Leptospira congkakensis]